MNLFSRVYCNMQINIYVVYVDNWMSFDRNRLTCASFLSSIERRHSSPSPWLDVLSSNQCIPCETFDIECEFIFLRKSEKFNNNKKEKKRKWTLSCHDRSSWRLSRDELDGKCEYTIYLNVYLCTYLNETILLEIKHAVDVHRGILQTTYYYYY